VEQELPALPEHMGSPPGFSGSRCCSIFGFLVFCVVLCIWLFVFLSFGNCVVCTPSIYAFGVFKLFLSQICSSSGLFVEITVFEIKC
jgi:hypothetical protein